MIKLPLYQIHFEPAVHRPQVPYASHAVLPSCVHPASVFMETHRRDVLTDAIVVDHRVRVVGVQVVHADVLITFRAERKRCQAGVR